MKNKKMYFLFSILIIFFSISIINKVLPNDVFSAIRIGDYIIHNGVDFVEHFNITEGLYYHNARWLFNVFVAIINNYFSFKGLYICVMVTSAIIGLAIFNILVKNKHNMIISFVLSLFTMYFMYSFMTIRAQIFSYLLFLLEVYFIERLIKKNKIRYIVYLSIISILVANIHTTVWPMCIIYFLPYFAEFFLSKIKFINKSKRLYHDDINILKLFISFIVVIASGFITPLGLTPFTYMFKTMAGISSVFIQELQPINIFNSYVMFSYTTVIIILLVWFKKKVKISDLFMIIGLYIMAITAGRNIPLLLMGTVLPISRLIKELLIDIDDKIEIITEKINQNNYLLCLIVLIVSVFSISNYSNVRFYNYISNSDFPIKATDYLIKNEDINNMRLFNNFNYGSYLEYRGINVFLDSRSEVYCEEFNDTTILKDWYNVSRGIVNYKTVFNKYNITHALVNKNDTVSEYIRFDDDYERVYSDKYFEIYKKKENKN